MRRGKYHPRGKVRADNPDRHENAEQRTNAAYEKLYRSLIPDDEWDAFYEALHQPLPITFRFEGPCSAGEERSLAQIRAENFMRRFNSILSGLPPEELSDSQLEAPAPLPWYPGGVAFQYSVPRTVLRKHDVFKPLHQFMVVEHEAGTISRQEAVSMVPPLFLDVKPHHRVLDMCAAPGSKTRQLLDALHSGLPAGSQPTGCVIANDLDRRRCQLLASNISALGSAAVAVTNCDASMFPSLHGADGLPLEFDSILADVICSGDGTIRKSPDLWRRFTTSEAIGVHPVQLRIAQRGAALLKVGGQMVYSTCSMNPVEDEGTLTALLRWARGSLELVDVSDRLPELKRRPGLLQWQVFESRSDRFYSSWDEVPEELRKGCKAPIQPTMFPDVPNDPELTGFSADELASMPSTRDLHIERAMRFYPHLQNTGGFFVAVLRKVAPLPAICGFGERTATGTATTAASAEIAKVLSEFEDRESDAAHAALMAVIRQRFPGWRELPLRVLPADSAVLRRIVDHLGLDTTGRCAQDGVAFCLRVEDEASSTDAQKVYIVTRSLSDILHGNDSFPGELQQARLNLVTAGLKITSKVAGEPGASNVSAMCISQEAIPTVAPWLRKDSILRVQLPADCVHSVFRACSERGDPFCVALKFSTLDSLWPGEGLRERLKALPHGHVFVETSDQALPGSVLDNRLFCGFIGVDSLTFHIRSALVQSFASLLSTRPLDQSIYDCILGEAGQYAELRRLRGSKPGDTQPKAGDVRPPQKD